MRVLLALLVGLSLYGDFSGYVTGIPSANRITIANNGQVYDVSLVSIGVFDSYKTHAIQEITTLCLHKNVRIQDYDKNSRVGVLICDDTNINHRLITNGFAYTLDDDRRFANSLRDAQIKRRGAWSRDELLDKYGYGAFKR